MPDAAEHLHAASSHCNLSTVVSIGTFRFSQANIMNVGTEWLVDADGCSAKLLRDVETVRSVCDRVVADLGLRLVAEPMWHQFPQPGGVTGLYLLTESHLACHTYPEIGIATFNLYCCRPRPRFCWEDLLSQQLGATLVTVRFLERGSESDTHEAIDATLLELAAAREVENQ